MGEDVRNFVHSVELKEDRCTGCTDCLKRCPTEAIRVRNKKAMIIDRKCVDCGLCIKICKNSAKQAKADSLECISQYKVSIAIPAPTLYTQFKGVYNSNRILTALKSLGFDDVIEVAHGAEIITQLTKDFLKEHPNFPKPVISSACPAVIKVITKRFPSLLNHVLPIISPKEATARYVRKMYIDRGYKSEEIGIFFITPCAAKYTTCHYPQFVTKSEVDRVIAIKDVYKPIKRFLKENDEYEFLRSSSNLGMRWAAHGGESKASEVENVIAVSGMEDVFKVLEILEDDVLKNIAFVECLACTGGCLGGALAVENPYVAENRMEKCAKFNLNHPNEVRELCLEKYTIENRYDKPLVSHEEDMAINTNLKTALEMYEQSEKILQLLPKIDCGACGSPTCKALAEDIVGGSANIEDCIFMLKAQIRKMAADMVKLAGKTPQSIDDLEREYEDED